MKTLLDKEGLVFNPPQLGGVLYLPGLPGAGSKIYDRSPYGNVGTIVGANWVRLPGGLWCLNFDGADDHVDFGTTPSLDITGDISIMAWVYPAAVGANQCIFSKSATLTQNGYILLLRSSDKVDFFTSQAAAYQSTYTADSLITQNTWQHLTVTRQGATAHIYRDGVDVTDTQGTHIDPTPSGQTARIGEMGTSYDFNGKIALPRVYKRALSAFEIQSHINREKRLFGVY